ncbi:MAG TPA: transglutaminase-like domain-containing protein, partial [Nocardioides sp.]
ARARRREALVGQPRGSVAAALTAVLTVTLVSGLVSLMVPDDNEVDRVLLKGDENAAVVAGAGESVVPRRVGSRTQLLKATGVPEGRRLRFAALDLYDGTSWVPAEESPGAGGLGTFKRIGHDVAPLHDGRTVGVRVQIRPGYSSDWLPMLGELTSLDLDYTDGRTQLTDVRYNQATSSALVVGGVNPRDDYTFGSVLSDDDFTRKDATRDATAQQRQPEGAFLDRYLRPFDREELRPVERVLLLARYLRLNGATRFVGSSSQAPVDLGLRLLGARDMTATPFQYTAVMALGASRLGVPARVVTGAEPDARGIVEHDDVTAWVELQFADGTWRTLDPSRYVGVHAPGEDPGTGGDAGGFVKEQLEQAAKGNDKEIRIPKGSPILLPEGTAIEQPMSPWEVLLRVLGGLTGLVTLALALVPLVKVVRRARRRRTTSWSGIYVNAWQEVLDGSRDLGAPVPDAWSRVAQARGLGAGIDLARRADAVVFAPHAAEPGDGRSFWDDCQALRRGLRSQAGARQRAWSYLNHASLLSGWRRRRASMSTGNHYVMEVPG